MTAPQADPAGYPQGASSTDNEFLRLLMQHQRLLFVYLRTLLNSSADAEEVLQETYVVIWGKRRQFELGTNFLNWAMTIAQFEVSKFRRDRKQTAQMLHDDVVVQIGSEMSASHDLIEARHNALSQCLQLLSERNRHLVNAAYGSHVKKRDIWTALGMTPDGFRKALQRVRQRLLKCIQYRLRAEGLI